MRFCRRSQVQTVHGLLVALVATVCAAGQTVLPVPVCALAATRMSQCASPTPRKRRPYDPEKQPPEAGDANRTATAREAFSRCLPANVDLDAATEPSGPGQSMKKMNVSNRLLQLRAHCVRSTLRDGKGKQIRFYQLVGCWGNPPDDYQEVLRHQSDELRRLERKYTVIRISCSSDPRLIQ
jgi:hypothetical protein